MNRWRVCKRDGLWRILDRGVWSDTYYTLPEAHTAATQYAVMEELFKPGALVALAELQDAYRPRNGWKDYLL